MTTITAPAPIEATRPLPIDGNGSHDLFAHYVKKSTLADARYLLTGKPPPGAQIACLTG